LKQTAVEGKNEDQKLGVTTITALRIHSPNGPRKFRIVELSKAENVGMDGMEAGVKKATDESARFLGVVKYN
jgi:hypothetical protein